MIKIIDPQGKERNVKDLSIVTHDVSSEEGEVTQEKFVQVTVIGNHREWINWYLLRDFRKLNPGVELNE